ncbi:Scr1 family TA system antitoxin-like transcriptional regulator [Actinomadura adrarensis]|uniref:Scr1 family TA system antitoxin-like transcriptional regulator n=1 Tax=Actinomadura adrarensis TaxID=1819600 RepID=A0ABW3CPC6_9ACTN
MPQDHPEGDWPLLAARQRHRPGGEPRTLDLIIDRMAVANALDEHRDVWREQVEHLLELSRDGHRVRIVPPSVGADAGLDGPFEIYEVSAFNYRLGIVHWPDGLGMSSVDRRRENLRADRQVREHHFDPRTAVCLGARPRRERPGQCRPDTDETQLPASCLAEPGVLLSRPSRIAGRA